VLFISENSFSSSPPSLPPSLPPSRPSDIEFTVEKDKLYVLQCRSGKRTAKAAVTMGKEGGREGGREGRQMILRLNNTHALTLPPSLPSSFLPSAVEMVVEGLISKEEALLRIDAKQMDFFLHPTIDPTAAKTVVAKGLPASPGVGTGTLCFTSDEAEILAKQGKDVLLVRKETTAEDVHGMKVGGREGRRKGGGGGKEGGAEIKCIDDSL